MSQRELKFGIKTTFYVEVLRLETELLRERRFERLFYLIMKLFCGLILFFLNAESILLFFFLNSLNKISKSK